MQIKKILEYEGTNEFIFCLLEIEDKCENNQLAMLYARVGSVEVNNKVDTMNFGWVPETTKTLQETTIDINLAPMASNTIFKMFTIDSIDEYKNIIRVVKDLVCK